MPYSTILKWSLSFASGLIVLVEPTLPFVVICWFAILFDCFTSYRLSKRVKRHTGRSTGKFRSNKANKVFATMIKMFVLIVLADQIDNTILTMFDGLYLANYVAFIFCFVQVWSILENESSTNNAPWARAAQRIMVDKTERHFDIDLHEFKHKEDE